MKSKRNRIIVGVISAVFLFGCLVCLMGISYGSWQILKSNKFRPLFFATPTSIATATNTVTPTIQATPISTVTLTHTITTPTLNLTPGPDCNAAACLKICMENLPDVIGFLNPGMSNATESLDWYSPGEPIGVYDLATYAVKGEKIKLTFIPVVPDRLKKYQKDTVLHQKIWDYFITIVPESARNMLTGFTLYTDGERVRNSAAEVRYSPPYYYLSLDIFDLGSPQFLTSALVHETGHLITLNKNQISRAEVNYLDTSDLKGYEITKQKCDYLFFDAWCAFEDSYVNLFYERFWKGRHDDTLYLLYYARYHSVDDDYYRIGKRLYADFPDEFIREYSATNLDEDMADSFEHFVLGYEPTGKKIADEKSAFFYEFPELVKLREHIIKGVCGYTAK